MLDGFAPGAIQPLPGAGWPLAPVHGQRSLLPASGGHGGALWCRMGLSGMPPLLWIKKRRNSGSTLDLVNVACGPHGILTRAARRFAARSAKKDCELY